MNSRSLVITKVLVTLFKPQGKYYTEEYWTIPEGAIGPYDMYKSPDWRTINGGPVLVQSQEPWGYPHLMTEEVRAKFYPEYVLRDKLSPRSTRL